MNFVHYESFYNLLCRGNYLGCREFHWKFGLYRAWVQLDDLWLSFSEFNICCGLNIYSDCGYYSFCDRFFCIYLLLEMCYLTICIFSVISARCVRDHMNHSQIIVNGYVICKMINLKFNLFDLIQFKNSFHVPLNSGPKTQRYLDVHKCDRWLEESTDRCDWHRSTD